MLSRHDIASNGRQLSERIWSKFPIEEVVHRPGNGMYFFDDFLNTPTLSADSDVTKYASYIDTSNTITQADEAYGIVNLTTDATDNDGPVIQTGGGTGGFLSIASGSPLTCFEARIRVVTLAEAAVFIGLAIKGLTADNGVLADNPDTTVAAALTDTVSCIGFVSPAVASGDVVSAAYQKASQTTVVPVASAHTLVANTFVKLGFVYDPADDKLRYIVNGAEVGNFDVSAAGTTTYPSGVVMALTAALKNGTTGARTLGIDWWACGQLSA